MHRLLPLLIVLAVVTACADPNARPGHPDRSTERSAPTSLLADGSVPWADLKITDEDLNGRPTGPGRRPPGAGRAGRSSCPAGSPAGCGPATAVRHPAAGTPPSASSSVRSTSRTRRRSSARCRARYPPPCSPAAARSPCCTRTASTKKAGPEWSPYPPAATPAFASTGPGRSASRSTGR